MKGNLAATKHGEGMLVYTGQQVAVGGWYLDAHRHRLFLRRGERAPICPRIGPAPVAWRLVVPLPSPRSTP